MSRWKQPPLTNVIIAAEKREKAISMVNKIFARPNPPVRFHEWSITVRRNIRRREADGTSSEDERRRAGVPPGFRVQEVAVEGGRAANGPPGKSVRFHLLLCLSYRPSRKFPPFTLFKICLTHWFNAPPSRFILLPFKRGRDPDRRVWTIVKMKKKKSSPFDCQGTRALESSEWRVVKFGSFSGGWKFSKFYIKSFRNTSYFSLERYF